jgi:hypothetical protein
MRQDRCHVDLRGSCAHLDVLRGDFATVHIEAGVFAIIGGRERGPAAGCDWQITHQILAAQPQHGFAVAKQQRASVLL